MPCFPASAFFRVCLIGLLKNSPVFQQTVLLSAILCSTLFLSTGALFPAWGQGVVVPVTALKRIAVSSISGTGGSAIVDVVVHDLNSTDEMAAMPNSSDGDYITSGSYSGTTLTATLQDRQSGQTVVSSTFQGDYRSVAHQLADAITMAVTGHPGFASSRLAFIAHHGGSKELYLADSDGFNSRAITHDHVICGSPNLNHDGSELAYMSYKSGYADVYLINLQTGTRTRVSYYPGINSGPCFSPDGQRIALTLSKDGNPEIYTMRTDGSDLVRITRTRGGETSPSWSPEGNRLVYSSDDRGGPQLYISSASGSPGTHLVTGDEFCTKPDWSPDGNSIAFTTRIEGDFQIGLYKLVDGSAHLVTTTGGEDPTWARDSRHLIYAHRGRLYLLDTVSGIISTIQTDAVGASEPSLSR